MACPQFMLPNGFCRIFCGNASPLFQRAPPGLGGEFFVRRKWEKILFSSFPSAAFGVYWRRKGGAGIKMRISDIQAALTPVFVNYGVSRAVLFGSQAAGTASEKSDLDLMVESGLRGLRFVGFMEAVRRAVEMPVDIFDVSHIERGSRLAQEIQAKGITIYEK